MGGNECALRVLGEASRTLAGTAATLRGTLG
jgi:hypothetical protein